MSKKYTIICGKSKQDIVKNFIIDLYNYNKSIDVEITDSLLSLYFNRIISVTQLKENLSRLNIDKIVIKDKNTVKDKTIHINKVKEIVLHDNVNMIVINYGINMSDIIYI